MELLWTAPRCSLCRGGISYEQDWAQQFTAIFFENHAVQTGNFRYTRGETFQNLKIEPGLTRRLRVDKSPFYPNQRVFIVHCSCHQLLMDALAPSPDTTELFRLYQALEPDKCQGFDLMPPFNLTGKLLFYVNNPALPLLPAHFSSWLQDLDVSPKSYYNTSKLLQLSPEVLILILKNLALPELINFLSSSKQLLSYTSIMFSSRTIQVLQQFTGSKSNDCHRIILALCSRFYQTRYVGFEERWRIILRVNALASYIHRIRTTKPTRQLTQKTHEPIAGSLVSLEYQQLILEIPSNDVEYCRIYTIGVDKREYIMALEIQSQMIGIKSSTFVDISVPTDSFDIIRFGQDEVGIRSLKFGDSRWSHGSPDDLQCWEGFSKRQGSSQLRILRDALKFRRIGWLKSELASFQERLVGKRMHPSIHGSISKETFIEKFFTHTTLPGIIPVSVVRFSSLQTITLFYRKPIGIQGISTQSNKETCTFGLADGTAISLSLQQPEEFVTELAVYISSVIDIELRTNLNNALRSSPIPTYANVKPSIFRSSASCRLTGFYFQKTLGIMSIGPIYENT